MLAHITKFIKVSLKAQVFRCSPLKLDSVSFSLSSYNHKIPAEPIKDDTVGRVSYLIKQPNWEQNHLLKSLVSHMNPYSASQVILLHNNIELQVRFFKWVCRQSTYCYDIDCRIRLLSSIVSSSLFGVAHKAIIALIKECSSNEDDILKIMAALHDIRKTGFALNYPCYSTLLMSLSKLNMGLLAYIVYTRMVADGFLLGLIDYRAIVNALCKNGFVEPAEMFMCRVLKLGLDLDVHICTSLVLGYCREKDLREAFRVFDIMSEQDGCGANSVTYSVLIHGLCEIGRLDEAFDLKEAMSEKGCPPSNRTYTILIKALCDRGLIGKALNLLGEMVDKGCKPDLHTYTVLIDTLCREGKIEEANWMFRKMVGEGLCPGTVTYNALINGYCKEGRIISAFELLSVMEKRNCMPNIRTYNELIDGLCRVNRPYKAMLLLKKVVDCGLTPNRVTYNILIDGFCREGQFDLAYRMFNTMSSFGNDPDYYSFTSMINGLCKQEKPELANALLGLMIKKGICPDEVTFTALIDGFFRIGNIGDASKLFKVMIESNCLNDCHAFNLFLHALRKECKLKQEYALFAKILKYGLVPSVVTYTILIHVLFEAGKIGQAWNMIEIMKQAGCPPNIYTYTVMIDGLCQNGRVEDAERMLYSMHDLGAPPNHVTYTILVKAHANAGRLDSALDIVSSMVKDGCQPNTRIYSALLAGFHSSDKLIEARSYSLTDHLDNETVSTNVLKAVDIELVYKLQEKIEKCGGSIPDFYNFLVVGLCKVGRIVDAENLTKEILKRGLFAEKACSSVIEWHCQNCRYDDCLVFMNLILSYGFLPSFASYCLVIHGLYEEGKSQEAQKLTFELLRCHTIGDANEVLPYLQFLVMADEPDKCVELLKLMKQMYGREKPII